jgi:hypothetical protein
MCDGTVWKENEKPTSCCCGGNCNADSIAKAENAQNRRGGHKGAGKRVREMQRAGSGDESGAGAARHGYDDRPRNRLFADRGLRRDVDAALVVDGKVVAYGKVLKTEEVVKILQKVRG